MTDSATLCVDYLNKDDVLDSKRDRQSDPDAGTVSPRSRNGTAESDHKVVFRGRTD